MRRPSWRRCGAWRKRRGRAARRRLGLALFLGFVFGLLFLEFWGNVFFFVLGRGWAGAGQKHAAIVGVGF